MLRTPASLRRLGISYPKTTVLKMELSFARLNPPADVDRDREPVPVVDPADLEKSMAASWRSSSEAGSSNLCARLVAAMAGWWRGSYDVAAMA